MNLNKFNPKLVVSMYNEHKNYNIMLKDSTVIIGAELEYSEDTNNYYFYNNGNIIELTDVSLIDKRHLYDLVNVGDGWVITKDGSKFFKDNTHGIMDNHLYAQSIMFQYQSYQDTYTPDTINCGDLVSVKTLQSAELRNAIVTNVLKPQEQLDHGMVEVYFLDDNQYFEHYTYIGWSEWLTVVEEDIPDEDINMLKLRDQNEKEAHCFMNSVLNNNLKYCVIFQLSEYSTTTPTNPNYFREEWKDVYPKVKEMRSFIDKVIDKETKCINYKALEKEIQKYDTLLPEDEYRFHSFQYLKEFMHYYHTSYISTKEHYSSHSVAHIYASEVFKVLKEIK